ncbi:TetR/AcrR family transcriptional regulator [Paenibacillus thiaminolyticus]|uniref:hypothetical protein n=1 Tax=Paenibacillus thiaminolyticus TaxID=49283 RepID=UPI0035A5FBA2
MSRDEAPGTGGRTSAWQRNGTVPPPPWSAPCRPLVADPGERNAQQEQPAGDDEGTAEGTERPASQSPYPRVRRKSVEQRGQRAAAGVSTGCFYAYFADKREVFVEALKRYELEVMYQSDAEIKQWMDEQYR